MDIKYLTNCDEHYDFVKNKPNHSILSLKCHLCNCMFNISKRILLKNFFPKRKNAKKYCSRKCQNQSMIKKIEVECKNCSKFFKKLPRVIKKHPNNFCSSSCSASYNNRHKTFGIRRSKMEILLEELIIEKFSNLNYSINNKNIIQSELDFYFPDLKFAIELNGIFHYKPIYGEEKLEQIKNNDKQKIIKCREHGIELCVIDISEVKYLNTSMKEKYKLIFTEILQGALRRKI